jgi:Transglycosylase-like domain
MPGRQHPEVSPLKKQVTILLLSACAIVPAVAAGAPALAQKSQPALETMTTSGGTGAAVFPQAKAAGADLRRAYRRWRRKLDHYGLHHGRNLVVAARSQQRAPTAQELRRSIHRMQSRFHRFLRTPEGRSVAFRFKVRRIPNWGKQHLESIAACESHGNPRAIGGGGSFRGMYQFTFSTWQVVGGSGDPAVASRHEQTWRAWLLLSRHGAGHWPICG